jgi:peptidoglycan hydrolase-like protein with peptidoglycan-binding domain
MVSDLQWQLAVHGYYPGSPDGVVGPRTRAAIRQYQADAGLPVDGAPSGDLLSHLQYSHPPVLNPRHTASASAMPPTGAEPAYGNYPPDSGAGYPPDSGGGYGGGYDGSPDYQGTPPGADLMRIYTVTVQQALAAKGYDPGPADGVLGRRTREAIRRYQRGYNLPVTGEVSLDLVNHLRLVSSYPEGYGPTAAQPYEAYPPDQTY